MAIPQEGEPSGDVLNESLRIVARVQADDAVSEHAPPLLVRRRALKVAMRDRQDEEDEVILREGALDSREAGTNSELTAFGSRLAGRHAQAGTRGEDHEEYRRLLDGRTPSTLLPAAEADRATALADLETRIEAKETAAEVKKDAAGLLKAIGREQEAVAERDKARRKLDQARAREAAAKAGAVQAARECAGSLQKTFSAEPARARRLLGQKETRRTKKKQKGDSPPPAPPAE